MPETTKKTEEVKEKIVEITLDNDHSINGEKYSAGTHKVPEGVAEDLLRNDKAHTKYALNLNKNNAVNSNQGSINAS